MDKKVEEDIKAYARKLRAEGQRERYHRDPERHRAYSAKWRKANFEKVRAYQREYYRKNKESALEYAKQYQKEHAEELKAKKREYYIKNRDRILAKQKERNEKKKRKTAHDIMSMDDFQKNNNNIIS